MSAEPLLFSVGLRRAAEVRESLWPSSGRAGWQVYAVLDAARDESLLPTLRASSAPHACLYEGPIPPAVAAVAPYLAQLAPHDRFTAELIEERWGRAEGIYVLCDAPLAELRRHFRRFLRVRVEAGGTFLFRFYDPRVLRAYLPTCDAGELATVCGPAAMFVVEGERGEVLRFPRPGGAVPGTRGLTVRAAQIDALSAAHLERQIAEHLRGFASARCEELGDGLGDFVRGGIAKARRLGFEAAGHVAQFVALMALFGPDFDTDPRLPWAGEILRDPEIEHPGTRMVLLVEEIERMGGAP